MTDGLFSSLTSHWATPMKLYNQLNHEFHFNDDPCPLNGEGGLTRDWGTRTYVNPPYGKEIVEWVRYAYMQTTKGKMVVMLLPSRTDTRWWHDYVMKAEEMRFIKGRVHFNESGPAPFPSVVVVYNPSLHRTSPLISTMYI